MFIFTIGYDCKKKIVGGKDSLCRCIVMELVMELFLLSLVNAGDGRRSKYKIPPLFYYLTPREDISMQFSLC